MRGPWARAVLVAVAGDERPTSHVEELDVAIGHLSARVGECAVTLAADRVPRATWVSMTRFARGMGPLEEAVGGRLQSPHLGVLLDEDWGEQLIPRPGQIRRTCSCDASGGCEHVAAVGLAFADAIDEDASLLLRGPRGLPVGAVLKRLGPSGILVGDEDLADVLQLAYEAYAD